jgi:hypothetical protein
MLPQSFTSKYNVAGTYPVPHLGVRNARHFSPAFLNRLEPAVAADGEICKKAARIAQRAFARP